ncbi:MAG: T9SS type B sorting domain-containing protein [Chitinophagaceae bacterium]|nr:MAG: T9SS type B sorting domain-containing protein [Chitinophagaceae bacterium]
MKKLFFILFFTTTLAFSQQEASVWYFGQNAGLKFNTDNSVTPLSDGQLVTSEGCSTISDANGNLLMYTDGRTLWDRNHIQMPNGSLANGTELFGDGSSTNSGIIIPKPGSDTIYYVFTVDEPHHENAAVYPNAFVGTYVDLDSGSTPTGDDGRNNGLNYSIVDLSVTGSNGSIGDVISRNNPLITYDTNPTGEEIKYKCSEKITAVKNEAEGTFWVITHFINRFYSFKVSSAGVISAPVVSVSGSDQALSGYRRNAIGCFKVSPDGTRLATAHQYRGPTDGSLTTWTGLVELFDFNVQTGQVSNPIVLIDQAQAYGVEFSPDSQKLYATYRKGAITMELSQFNLAASDVPASKAVIYNNQSYYLLALQLAPNNKIYCATAYSPSLGVINNPDALGTACNYVHAGQPLAPNTIAKLGLPPFVTSFLNASFTTAHLCLGDSTQFNLSASQNVTSATWDFGDGTAPANTISPTHQYASSGSYTVTVTAVGTNGTATKTKTITIGNTPVVSAPIPDQAICGALNTPYSLSQNNSIVLGTQSPTAYGVTYFGSMADALAQTNQLPQNYVLTLGANTFYAKVYNLASRECYVLDDFTVTLFLAPTAAAPQPSFVCDDVSNDGLAIFDLTAYSPVVLGSQNPSQFGVSYYLTQADADSASNPISLNYQNASNPQTIYARVTNNQSASCFATAHFQIGVFRLPTATQPGDLYGCDAGDDGHEPFEIGAQAQLAIGGQTLNDVNVTCHLTQLDADTGANPLASPFSNTSNPQPIFVRVENILSTSCFSTTSFLLHVMPEPELTLDATYTICEGHPITITAPAGFTSYAWSNGSSASSATFDTAGPYTLTATRNYGPIACETTKGFTILKSNIATITNVEIRDWTDDDNVISVFAEGDGVYEYSLDGINYQDSSTFSNLNSGEYTVYVNDKKHCGYTTKDVLLLMYPKFFTPNGDGINDTWRIKFSNAEPDMELTIFDRFGKVIKRFRGTDFGWDGTFDGQALFSDDYWFVIKRQNGKIFRGHFAMKR